VGAAASLVNFESWQDFVKQFSLNESLDEKLWKSLLFNGRQYDAWHRLREIEETRYLNLVMPRCLARLPYEFEEKPNQEYMFKEKIQKSTINHKQYVWINAAYARGATIVDSFAKYGWFARIAGFGDPETKSGFIDKLPAHIFPILTPFADEGI
jgi:type VI secretion system protein ImpC